ncbi:hypothetical protein YB2330_001338 [Saitoella coloradoensis]
MLYCRLLRSRRTPKPRIVSQPWRVTALCRKHIILPALFGNAHIRPVTIFGISLGTLPTRLESIFIFAYVAMNVILCCVGITTISDNVVLKGTVGQVAKYVGARTGVFAFANLPLLFGLAGRNNVLIWLTGWEYNTFNMLHRWVGRVVALQTFAHVIAYGVFTTSDADIYSVSLFRNPWAMGATIGLVVMMLGSISHVRKMAYEIFLVIHLIMVAVFMVGSYVHVLKANTAQLGYIQAGLAIWGFDRFVRLLRMFVTNIPWTWLFEIFPSSRTMKRCTEVYVEVVPNDAIRCTVRVPAGWNFMPGQYVFMSIPQLGWSESHPFTVMEYMEEEEEEKQVERVRQDSASSIASDATLVGDRESPQMFDVDLKNMDIEKAIEVSSDTGTAESGVGPTFTVLIRPQTGFTKRLLEHATRSPSSRHCPLKAVIEGPYGVTHPYWSYESVLLIAGGVGITYVVPYIAELMHRRNHGETLLTRQIHLIWAIRSESQLTWIEPYLHKWRGPLREGSMRIDIYITSENHPGATWEKGAMVKWGRPVMRDVVEGAVRERVGGLVVGVCGSAGISDDTRKAVADVGNGEVEYVEAAFTW